MTRNEKLRELVAGALQDISRLQVSGGAVMVVAGAMQKLTETMMELDQAIKEGTEEAEEA